MRSDLVVLTPEVFDHDLRIDPISEPLHVQAFVTELAVERFIHSIQPGFSRIDVRGVNVGLAQPLQIALETNSGPLSDLKYFGAP